MKPAPINDDDIHAYADFAENPDLKVAIMAGADQLEMMQKLGVDEANLVTIAANAVPIPEIMPYAEATNFPTLYPTAYGALKWKANLQPGEVLLVHGAGGGSGLTGIEVGKPANLLILPAENGFDAVRRQVPVRYSIRHGKVIAQTRPAQTEIVLGQPEPIDFRR